MHQEEFEKLERTVLYLSGKTDALFRCLSLSLCDVCTDEQLHRIRDQLARDTLQGEGMQSEIATEELAETMVGGRVDLSQQAVKGLVEETKRLRAVILGEIKRRRESGE